MGMNTWVYPIQPQYMIPFNCQTPRYQSVIRAREGYEPYMPPLTTRNMAPMTERDTKPMTVRNMTPMTARNVTPLTERNFGPNYL